tara:strand:+ start:1525 stop:1899 length:375 start_codon:yes stop_codon:yes gene_type:complete
MAKNYEKNSITLWGAVAMGTGVMIGAGIFALTGQIAELAGSLFPLSFVVGAVVTAFSAYTYIKMSNAFPSAGGDAVMLTTFAAMKWQSDPLIVVFGAIGMALVFLFVWVFLAHNPVRDGAHDQH